MAALPRTFVTVGASFLAARSATRLLAQVDAEPVQKAVFKQLIPGLAQGFVWAAAGVEAGMTYDDFRSRVALQTHQDLARHIDSMTIGAEDVLWPGRCSIFARKAGTTPGPPRLIPVTEAMLAHFHKAGIETMLWYSARARNNDIYRGRHLHLGGSTALAPIAPDGSPPAFAGDLSGVRALNLPSWMERHLYEPGQEIAQRADGPAKLAAIVERTYALDITLLEGQPRWVLKLARALRARAERAGRGAITLRALWPHLELLVHGGVPIAPYRDELRELLGAEVEFHEVYAACEGILAAQDGEAEAGLRLAADAGVFFEFLPMSDYAPGRLHLLGARAVPVGGVREGVDYGIILSTPAGLARYFIGDVVRFVSTQPPRFVYMGRAELRLNAFGENVGERDLTEILVALCRRHGWTAVGFHVAPFFTPSTTGFAPGRHEWWLELQAAGSYQPNAAALVNDLDRELGRRCPAYQTKRAAGALELPLVRLVAAGTFEQWLRRHGKWGGEGKLPHCAGDRTIADELGRPE